jgi:hypothetical protein
LPNYSFIFPTFVEIGDYRDLHPLRLTELSYGTIEFAVGFIVPHTIQKLYRASEITCDDSGFVSGRPRENGFNSNESKLSAKQAAVTVTHNGVILKYPVWTKNQVTIQTSEWYDALHRQEQQDFLDQVDRLGSAGATAVFCQWKSPAVRWRVGDIEKLSIVTGDRIVQRFEDIDEAKVLTLHDALCVARNLARS